MPGERLYVVAYDIGNPAECLVDERPRIDLAAGHRGQAHFACRMVDIGVYAQQCHAVQRTALGYVGGRQRIGKMQLDRAEPGG